MLQTKLFHDLVTIFPEQGGDGPQLETYTVCKNEPFSFQMAYRLFDDPATQTHPELLRFHIRLTTPLDVHLYHVACVPVMHTFSRLNPGLPIGMYPDILVPKKTNPPIVRQTVRHRPGHRYIEEGDRTPLVAYGDSWQQVWFAVNEDGDLMPPGKHRIIITLFDITGSKLGENSLILEVLDAMLPEQTLYYTNWFHNDCLADYYNLPLFSDEYYSVMEDFLRQAVRNGMNMLLLPAFTPPLDTAIGEERMTVQLVNIRKEGQCYHFDFTPMKRYIDVARRAGIRYFEHTHLFTQWGAAHAPKILAEVNGTVHRLFGWETEAAGEEYVTFLRAYIPAVREFLRSLGLENKTLFHVSDEPAEDLYESYKQAADSVRPLLEGCMTGDALSVYKYYETGLVPTPIVKTDKVRPFIGRCDDLWLYYTGTESFDGLSNRLIQLPRERNRSMGFQLYWAKAKGFLHWAYNFYYGQLSYGLYDPAQDPCCGFPNAGTAYSVYPGPNGKPLQSIRQKIFGDALVDLRALQLLESLSDREVCMALIRSHFGEPDIFNTADDPQSYIAFRQAINKKIKELS